MINRHRTRESPSFSHNIKSCKTLNIMSNSNRIRILWLMFQIHHNRHKWYTKTSRTSNISKVKGKWWVNISSRWPHQPRSVTEYYQMPQKMHFKICSSLMSKKLGSVAANLTLLALFSRKLSLPTHTKHQIASNVCHQFSWTLSFMAKQLKTTQQTTSTF